MVKSSTKYILLIFNFVFLVAKLSGMNESLSSSNSGYLSQVQEEKLLHINTKSKFTNGVEFSYASDLYKILNSKVKNCILKKLFNDPCSLLNENDKINMRFVDNFSYEAKEKFTPEIFKDLSQKYPLFRIRECTTKSCLLCRQEYPNRRDFSEKKIVNDIKNNFSRDQTLTYVAYAPGDLLSDIIILSRLIAEGYAKINVVLIGKSWSSEYISDVKSMGEYVSLNIKHDNPEKENWLRWLTYQLAQFVQWLQVSSPEIKVIVYNSVESYQEDCMRNDLLLADVVVALDYIVSTNYGKSFQEMSLYDLYSLNYLILHSLKENGRLYECESINLIDLFSNRSKKLDAVLRISKKTKFISRNKLDDLDKLYSGKIFVSFEECFKVVFQQLLPVRENTFHVCSINSLCGVHANFLDKLISKCCCCYKSKKL
jgi:hypothetical protein